MTKNQLPALYRYTHDHFQTFSILVTGVIPEDHFVGKCIFAKLKHNHFDWLYWHPLDLFKKIIEQNYNESQLSFLESTLSNKMHSLQKWYLLSRSQLHVKCQKTNDLFLRPMDQQMDWHWRLLRTPRINLGSKISLR